MSWRRWDGPDLILDVRVQPRAGRDQFVGIQGDRLKLRITAPPVDGRANDHLLGFLAERFGVTRSAVCVEAGAAGRNKRLRIQAPRKLPDDLPDDSP